MPNINLKTSDGKIIECDVELAKCSGTIKMMIEDFAMDEYEDSILPLPNVDSAILCRILKWADHHKDMKDSAKATDDKKESGEIDEWDKDFLKVHQVTLFEIMVACDYLDIQDLLNITSQTVANMMKGKTPEEIRGIFNIRNDLTDFTPAEVEEAREENK